MFTGIIEERGEVLDLTLAADGDSARLTIRAATVTGDVGHGDSIAVSGVCLTVVDRAEGSFTADVMAETLGRTTLGALAVGDEVNLERSVLPTTRMGGHVVQGHVDGVGTLVSRTPHPAWDEIRIGVGPGIARYIAGKGAIAVDGISLTVIDVVDAPDGTGAAEFGIGVIPETRAATTLGGRTAGDRLNIEVDVMAKYVERLLGATHTDGTTP
ncbi:MAG: riboflavin synthase [Nakamurella sp.]